MAFGAYPYVSLADARSKRDEAYSVLCEGRDPNVAKKTKIEENIEAGRQRFERVARDGTRTRNRSGPRSTPPISSVALNATSSPRSARCRSPS